MMLARLEQLAKAGETHQPAADRKDTHGPITTLRLRIATCVPIAIDTQVLTDTLDSLLEDHGQ